MTGNSTPVLLITANVGSIFEEPSSMLQAWAKEFLSTISRLDPKFVALHCQEVGGKNYEKSMQYVRNFVKLLMESEELRLFDKVRIYLDEDFSSADKFTALGNFYFVHESITDALIYDFNTRSFVEVDGQKVHSEDIETESTKEKSKFPLEYFPECKWSRKGYLRTRWSIKSTVFDMVNIHLFHDASNFVAIESFPSEYSETRRQALFYTLERFQSDEHETVPFFMFGDFNFRTDTQGVVKRLSEGLCRSSAEGDSEESTVEYCDNDKKVLCLGKKTFSHLNHQEVFCGDSTGWLRSLDLELDSFRDHVFEFDVGFQPSYPFEEGETCGELYMKTRCPAWCDRVLLSKDALALVKDFSNPANIEYGLMGKDACMGDHKPVFLKIEVRANAAKDLDTKLEGQVIMSRLAESGDSSVAALKHLADIDTGQPENFLERTGVVKRVNSASLVENKCRREDWKNNRCNSDVSWNPATSQEMARINKLRTSLLRGNSKIRLISSTTGINLSLPRLTSHHSSSDEEWFEIVDGDDDVLEMNAEEQPEQEEGLSSAEEPAAELKIAKKRNPFSILKSLNKESHLEENKIIKVAKKLEEEATIDNIPEPKQSCSKAPNFLVLKTQALIKNVKRNRVHKEDLAGSWETIDLADAKPKVEDDRKGRRNSCCCLQ